MDLWTIAAELRKVAEPSPPLDRRKVLHARSLLELPRYDGDEGPELLLADLRSAIRSLPAETSNQAARLFQTPEIEPPQGGQNWTNRLTSISADNSAARRFCWQFVLSAVAYQLQERWRQHHAMEGVELGDPFERLSYTAVWEIDEEDPTRHVMERSIHARVVAPVQRYADIYHEYLAGPVEAQVEALTPGHSFVGTVDDPGGPHGEQWRKHVLDLGRAHKLDDKVWLCTRECFRDDRQRMHDLSKTDGLWMSIRVSGPSFEFVDLSVKLPDELAATASVQAKVEHRRYPLVPHISWDVTPDEGGLYHARFESHLDVGNWCGLFIRGVRLPAVNTKGRRRQGLPRNA